MKRQVAFVNAGKHLKGALHCHTTRSDGKCTPEYTLAKHAAHGYDFVALTDHRYYNYANYGDAPLTIIPGMEMDGGFVKAEGESGVHCHHTVCLGHTKENGNGFEQDQRFESYKIEKPEDTQPVLDDLHENGNMTIYCHPEWSGTPASDFRTLRGNFAMEIWNSGCVLEDGLDTNAAYWDDLLAEGQKIYGVATDDGHQEYQHCVGWVRVNSENNVESILSALKDGAFYSSCGPEIYDFYVEDGVAHVKCSPVVEISFRHLRMPYHMTTAEEGKTLEEGEIKLRRAQGAMYIRAVVKDAQGRRAWTNPIFLEAEDYQA